MHYNVWIITSKTARDFGPATSPEDVRKELEEDAERICEHLYEHNLHRQQGETFPPLYYDWKETGGRWYGNISPETEEPNYAASRAAAEHHDADLPRAVVTPGGRYALVSNFEEKPELRRVLLHWPDNIVLAQDWHS